MIKRSFNLESFKAFMELLERCTDEYMYVYDINNNWIKYSKAITENFDLEKSESNNAKAFLKNVIHPDDFQMVTDNINDCFESKLDFHNLEYRWKNRKGSYSWINCRGEMIECDGNYYLVGRIAEISRHSRIDGVTGLYSGTVLREKYTDLAKEPQSKGFLMLIGVDNFKEINEKYGVANGDEVLYMLASIIKKFEMDPFRVFRMPGDEMAILMPEDSQDIGLRAKNLYKRIRNEIDYEIEKQKYQIIFNISAGAVAFDATAQDYNDVLRNVRFTLHTAKIKGKNRFDFFTKEQYESYIAKLELQDELRRCINNNFEGFELYYQPIYDAKTKSIDGAEALIRWNGAKYGFMSPVQFIPLLEESALIIPLGRWIIDTAAKACNTWITNVPHFVMHINLSCIQLIKSNILRDVLESVSRFSASNSHYVFEITESLQMDSTIAIKRVLEEFGENDFKLAIDDFGTGYSNFGYMKEKLFHIVKIDRSFITDINLKKNNYLLVGFIIKMAHEMGLKVCIEGVETAEELSCVTELDADYIQGYYYGKPVSYDEFNKMHLKGLVINE